MSACRIEVGLQVGESALRSSGFAASPEMLSMLTEESIIRAVQAFKARAKGMSTLHISKVNFIFQFNLKIKFIHFVETLIHIWPRAR
jgi:hypothetical protein